MVKYYRALAPDHQLYDKVVITTQPRYKVSDRSGNEWRISANIEFYKNGAVIATSSASSVPDAIGTMQCIVADTFGFESKTYTPINHHESLVCDQEGCDKPYTVLYKQIKTGCCKCGHTRDSLFDQYRAFCDEHSTRGDASLDDSDDNYKLVEGTISAVLDSAKSHSVLGGIIYSDTIAL